jgi:hypothetical protein
LFKTLKSTSLSPDFSSYRAVPERSLRSGFCLFLDKENYIDITVPMLRNPNLSQTGSLEPSEMFNEDILPEQSDDGAR